MLRRARDTHSLTCATAPASLRVSPTGMRAMASAVQDLLDILDLEELDLNLFRGR